MDALMDMIEDLRELQNATNPPEWACLLSPEKRERAITARISWLRNMSGQDFGDNIDEYEQWFTAHQNDWWKFSIDDGEPVIV